MSTEQSQATERGSIPVDSFGNRLMLARAHAGHISIREAADLCNLGRGAWTNWEKGARPADIIEISAIVADKLGVDRDWLLFGGRLGEAEPRTGRRVRVVGADGEPNVRLDHLTRSASRRRPNGHRTARAAAGIPPTAHPRRDRTRPPSTVPATSRRPVSVRPPARPMAT